MRLRLFFGCFFLSKTEEVLGKAMWFDYHAPSRFFAISTLASISDLLKKSGFRLQKRENYPRLWSGSAAEILISELL